MKRKEKKMFKSSGYVMLFYFSPYVIEYLSGIFFLVFHYFFYHYHSLTINVWSFFQSVGYIYLSTKMLKISCCLLFCLKQFNLNLNFVVVAVVFSNSKQQQFNHIDNMYISIVCLFVCLRMNERKGKMLITNIDKNVQYFLVISICTSD